MGRPTAIGAAIVVFAACGPAGASSSPASAPVAATASPAVAPAAAGVAGSEQPAGAARGGRIAFVHTHGDDDEIFVMNADGSARRQLTDNTAFDGEPAISPDGKRIAFTSNRSGGNPDVYLMRADGSDVRRLTDHAEPDSDPTFSPDGRQIAFRSDRRTGTAEIYVMNLGGSDLTRLTDAGPDDKQDYQPSWGPDGVTIAFTSDRDLSIPLGSRNEIFLMRSDGSDQRRITRNKVNDSLPAFAPSGKRIAFWSNEADGNVDVYTMNVDGTDRERLTRDEANDNEPTFAPDGSGLAFTSTRTDDYDPTRGGGAEAIWVMDADGANPVRLAAGRTPSWGPAPAATR